VLVGERCACGEGGVKRGHDCLLDLGAAEAFGGGGEGLEVELPRAPPALLQVNGEDLFACGLAGEVDEEDLIKPSLPQQFWRQPDTRGRRESSISVSESESV